MGRLSHMAGLRRPLLLFLATLGVFLLSPTRQIADSRYVSLLSESLLSRGAFHLDGYLDLPGLPTEGDLSWPHLPHQLEVVDGHLYYWFPPGGAVLSVPLVGLLKLAGISAVGADGKYSAKGDWQIQKRVAALVMALFVVVVYSTARLLLPTGWSTMVTLAVAFGTQVWSTASRALWSHTWAILLLGIVVHHLLAVEARGRKPNPLLLASLLAWAYFTRPTSVIPAAAVACYLWFSYRDRVPALAATLAAWLALFCAWSLALYGRLLPSYFSSPYLDLDGQSFVTALAGNLVSPSRGLLVFVPQILLVVYLLVRYRDSVTQRPLVWLSAGIFVLHWLSISTFGPWWGGHSYGARLMTDVVPWLGLLAILGLAATLERRTAELSEPSYPTRRERAVGALLLAWGVYANGVGAIFPEANTCWNERPVELRDDPARLWDWKDPQFLGWRRPSCESMGDGRP